MHDSEKLPDDDLFVQALNRDPPPKDSFYDLVATAIMICGGVSEKMVLYESICVELIHDRIGGTGDEIRDTIDELVENGDVIAGSNDIADGYYVSEQKQEELRAIIRERRQEFKI